ncbi:MAG: hypothetical protein EOO03_04835 [Chitinophagaceae bacterium]|nr:MAG: hypothetical protein EOO03_04835 [Chitinophagaceae bacterium]
MKTLTATAICLTILLSCISGSAQSYRRLSKPEQQFEMFWNSFKDNYAFFPLKNVNWDSSYLQYRPLVNKKTSTKELVSILGRMANPLKDGHITISKGDNILYKGNKPSWFKQEFGSRKKEFWNMVQGTLRQEDFSSWTGVGPVFAEEHLYYVAQNERYGYIRISRCFANLESLFSDKKEADDTALMLKLFDSLLTTLAKKDALIIDVRANGGGHGGTELASRFVADKTVTHYKAIKVKGNYESYSALTPYYAVPNAGIRFLKPVVILTNDKTASSAEDFTIALYQQANVTTVGSNTSGMLSDMYEQKLSKKISFTLSNQAYYSTQKEMLEDTGVPAKIKVVNSTKDLKTGKDPVLVAAIKSLQ